MRSNLHRRELLLGMTAISLLRARSVRAAEGVSQVEWMNALGSELGLLGPGETKLAFGEWVRRLDRPALEVLGHGAGPATAGFGRAVATSEGVARSGGGDWTAPAAAAGTVVFRTLVRRPGRHSVRVSGKGGPHLVSVGTHTTRSANNGDDGQAVDLHGVRLPGGWLDIAVAIAPGGSIGSLTLVPEAASPLSPLKGWQEEKALNYGDLATTLVRLGGWEDELPAADLTLMPATIVDSKSEAGRLAHRIEIKDAGTYTLAAGLGGPPPTMVLLDGAQLFPNAGVPGAGSAGQAPGIVSLGTVDLAAGLHDVSFTASPGGPVLKLLQLRREAKDSFYLQIARAHDYVLAGSATTSVDPAGLAAAKAALRTYLDGLQQSAVASSASAASAASASDHRPPPPPSRPLPLTPLSRTDRGD